VRADGGPLDNLSKEEKKGALHKRRLNMHVSSSRKVGRGEKWDCADGTIQLEIM